MLTFWAAVGSERLLVQTAIAVQKMMLAILQARSAAEGAVGRVGDQHDMADRGSDASCESDDVAVLVDLAEDGCEDLMNLFESIPVDADPGWGTPQAVSPGSALLTAQSGEKKN